MKKLSLIMMLFLVGCSNTISATPAEQPTLPSTLTPVLTNTPISTATNTPAPTATLVLPVNQGTPFPYQLPAISAGNAARLGEVFRLQDAPIIWNRFSAGDYTVLDTNQGVQIQDKQGTIIANLPSAEVYCPASGLTQYSYSSGKVFISSDNKVAIATGDEVRIYSFQGGLLQAMPLKKEFIPNNDACGAEGVYRFSPNLEWVAVGYPVHMDINNISVSVYDLRTGSSVLEVPKAYMPRFFTPDGKYLIVEEGNSRFFVYQTSDWTRVSLLSAAERFLGTDLSLSPDGQLLVAYPSEGVLTFYQVLKGNKIPLEAFTCGDLPNCGADVQFSKDGKQLRVEGDKGVFLYDLSTWQKIDSQGGYNASQWEKAIPETNFIQPDYEKALNKTAFTFSGHNGAFIAALGSDKVDNNFCLTLTNGGEICNVLPPIEKWETKEFGKTTIIPLTDELIYRCILFSNNDLNCFTQDPSHQDMIPDPYFQADQLCIELPDGITCTSFSLSEWSKVNFRLVDGIVQISQDTTNKYISFRINESPNIECVLDLENKPVCWFSISAVDTFYFFESISDGETDICTIGLDGNRPCKSFPAGKMVSTDSKGNLYTLFRVEPNRLQLGWESDNTVLTTMDIDPQGRVLWFQVLAEEKYLAYAVQSELADGIHIKLRIVTMDGVELHSRDVAVIKYYAVSPDGRYFAHSGFANYDTVRGFVWDIGNSQTVFKWTPSGFNIDAMAFTPDSRYFVYIERSENKKEPWKERGSVRFIDLETQKVARELPVEFFHNGVNVMAFSPDGKLLTMGLNDGTVLLFDVDSAVQITSWKAHIGQVKSLEFSPDGKLLLSSGALDGKASLWGVYP